MKTVKIFTLVTAIIGLFFLGALPQSLLGQTPPPNDFILATPSVAASGPALIWSSGNKIFIDISKTNELEASIEVYSISGQEVYTEKLAGNTFYLKEMARIPTGYVLVKLTYGNTSVTRKLLILNNS